MEFYLFPYSQVDKGSRIILAGPGKVGRSFAAQLLENKYCEIVAVTGRKTHPHQPVNGIEVVPHEAILSLEYDKVVVSAEERGVKDSILSELKALGVEECKIIASQFYCTEWDIATTEALVIKAVFDLIGIPKPSYIDVGACHPHRSSNTMLFYMNGSRGINIEPNQELKDEFYQYRPEDINLFVGVGTGRGEGIFYKSDNPFVSTFLPSRMGPSQKMWGVTYEGGESVPLMTLNDIVDEYCDGIFPDFIDVDIEGMDAEVLRCMDVSVSSPKLICMEGQAADILAQKKCRETGGGYVPYCRITCNTIYLREDIYKQVFSKG